MPALTAGAGRAVIRTQRIRTINPQNEMGKNMTTNRFRNLPAAPLEHLFGTAEALRSSCARRLASDGGSSERGDVPGWVMITLMSAALVAGLLALATPALAELFNNAMDKVNK